LRELIEKIGKYDKYTNAFITIRSKEEVLREVKETLTKGAN